jgi:hypothetical protein
MNWERVQTVTNRHAKDLGAKRVWPQQFGTSNGFGIAADWGNGKKSSVMVSRMLPDSMTDDQLEHAIFDAIMQLGEGADV